MVEKKIKISSILKNQLPSYVREEFPLIEEFLSQYYVSLEQNGSALDLIENLDAYVKIDNLANLTDFTTLTSNIDFFDDTIYVNSTSGFPNSYGLIQIDSEIITYTGITTNSFTGCIRGFSGVSSYQNTNKIDSLVFSESEIATHSENTQVKNLSILFLKEFFKKIKIQITPGFENRELNSNINQSLFIKQSRDFYSSKGTDQSFEILFRALYGEDVEIIKPRDYLLIPSDAQYRVTKDLVVKAIEGNPEELINRTLYQDATDSIPSSSGSITKVEKIQRNNQDYYILSLDYDYNKDIIVEGSLFGNFSIHPTTRLITKVNSNSNILDVDSTVGFPSSGSLIIRNSDGTITTINYQSKSLNQFFDCSGIDRELSSNQLLESDLYAYGYSGLGTSNVVKVRITGVLSELEKDENNYYYEPGDIVSIKNPGIELKDFKSNHWVLNIPISFNVKEILLENISNYSYRITTFDSNKFVPGDQIKIISSDGTEKISTILSILNSNSFIVGNQGEIDTSRIYTIQKLLSKTNLINLENYTTNIQNVYTDKESLFIASNSLPTYLNQNLTPNYRSIIFSGTDLNGEILTIPNHGFYTGDSITYTSNNLSDTLNLSNGIYFIKKVDENQIKLARSRENIFNNIFLTLVGTVTEGVLELTDFANKSLKPQKLLRKLSTPINDDKKYETLSGKTGILINGVEILNYKSNDSLFYGPIEKINVVSEGNNYDVINPPVITITDSNGTGASGYCEVEGKLERIEIVDGGFDYLNTPIITITGGNGNNAIANPNLITINHSINFNSTSPNQVNLSTNLITFSEYHKFRDGEEIIYKTNGGTSIGGLSDGSSYFASIQSPYSIKLHKSFSDAIFKQNEINLSSYGTSNHIIESKYPKKVIGSITILNSGFGYTNRKIVAYPSGINTSNNTITVQNHRYQSGEMISYIPEITPIGGLTTSNYFVTKIDDNTFKLSEVGIGSTNSDLYYKNKEYINLTSRGTGKHIFNYPEIKINVSGKIGVSTVSGQDFNAVLKPIFRGQIKSVFVENGGIGYGSSEILNYNRQPSFDLNSGSGALLKPIVSNGKLVNVVIQNSGQNYNSAPDINVIGSGKGASLVPIITDGKIKEVKIVNQGVGYDSKNISIQVTSAGNGADFKFNIKKWTINLFERLLQSNQISEDDSVITKGLKSDFELEYSHLYSPRKLREISYGTKKVDGKDVFVPDLQLQNGIEVTSDTHSPILGWAYDGNPIYGPYGYSTLTGGNVRIMKSGYSLKVSSDRPPTSIFPEGFFVEDFIYQNNGDLDEHNGRFCVTPEYPNGVYAYFTTINPISVDPKNSKFLFKDYRRPQFPYFIGNTFKSKPINYNFEANSNQDDIDLQKTNLIRNTYSYNFTKQNSYYNFIQNPNEIQKQNSEILSVKSGEIQSLKIINSGDNYQVNDLIVFDNTNTNGDGAIAKISEISGKEIEKISIASTSVFNVEIVPYSIQSSLIGFSPSPHSLKNSDVISLDGFNTSRTDLQTFFTVGISSSFLTLANDVNTTSITGIITYFNVYGSLNYPSLRENDILKIGEEKVKVLNIDSLSSRIRVLREYDGTVGSSHTALSLLIEDSRKFTFKVNSIQNDYQYNFNKEYYFNPKETVGLGVGIGSTLFFSNPGAGITQISIPTKCLYFTNHNLNTGDELKYYTNGGTALSVSSDGVNNFQLSEGQSVYVAKITNDLIGIATSKVGLGSTGSFVGINSSISVSTLYFTEIGTGENHSFKTNLDNVLKGNVNKNYATVVTKSNHNLKNNDKIYLNVFPKVTKTITVKYDDYNRKLIVNPKDFTNLNVNVVENTIYIQNHDFVTGQKVIHTSSSPSGGLVNNSIYYVYVVDEHTIKLCSSFLNSTNTKPIEIDITSASSGTLSKINPQILVERNQEIIFDLSDSSLSFENNGVSYSAFDFNFYTDSTYNSKFYSSSITNSFEVSKNGTIGISSDASVKIKITDYIPEKLYYNLVPINLDYNTLVKKEISNDTENIVNSNALIVVDNILNGNQKIVGISSTSFIFNLQNKPKESEYTPSNSKIYYNTSSKSTSGPISKIDVISPGRNYKKLPGISKILSDGGKNALLLPVSNNIGKILKTKIQDIGFEYFSDKTLRPEVKLPQILKIEPFSSFEKIGISFVGKNYTISPNLIVLDGITKKQILDVDLKYSLGDNEVTILKNTKALSNVTPIIIPIQNSNGIPISNITFDNLSKDVVVSLGVSYSSYLDFPFEIGDQILIENISIGIDNSEKGYNSSNYDYSLFTITQIDPNIGGSNPSVTYNLTNYLNSDETPGSFDPINSSGRIVPSKYFPVFDIKLIKNSFFKGEKITSHSAQGIANSWDEKNGYLRVSSTQDYIIGESIIGSSSNSQGLITEIIDFDASYKINSFSIVEKGWNRETGFLNNNFQRIHDSDYYQYFSYSVKSKIPYERWNNAVSNLNHTAGFKKFAELIVESKDSSGVGIETNQNNGDFTVIPDNISVIDLNCVNDFDLATERTLSIDSKTYSDEIVFKSAILQDYIESIGNRVLMIDDISIEFDSNPRPTKFSVVDSFELDSTRSKKYLIYIKDKIIREREIALVTIIHNGSNGFLNQYGKVDTSTDLGFFDFAISGTKGQLQFYPSKYKVNNYDVSFITYSISDSISGIGTFDFGDTAKIVSDTQIIPVGTSIPTTIVGIASTCRASKILIQYKSTDNDYFEFDELSVIHNNSEIVIQEYGQLTTNSLSASSSLGIGTYSAYFSGSNINIDVTPNVGLGTTYIVNSICVSIANTSSTGVSTSKLNTGIIDSRITSIASSTSPIANNISEYSSEYSCSYYLVSIEDTTNNQYQLSELTVVSDEAGSYLTEFGIMNTGSILGSFDSNVINSKTYLTFTPIENINVEVRVFQNAIRLIDSSVEQKIIDLNSN